MTYEAIVAVEELREVPGPGWRLMLRIPELRRDPLKFLRALAEEYQGIVRLSVPKFDFLLVTRPEFVQHVLQTNQRNYTKGDSVELARVLVGQGLATSDGQLWLEQRRLMQPAFHHTRLEELAGLMVETAEAYLTGLEEHISTDNVIDLAGTLMQMTLHVIVRTMFSHDISDQSAQLGSAFTEALRYIDRRSFGNRGAPAWFPSPANLRFKRALRTLDAIVFQVADDRRANPDGYRDLLAMLLAARDLETGKGMSRGQLRDEVVTLFFAGHETTALTLTWALAELLENESVSMRLDAELEAALGGRSPTLEDLENLPYTRMILDETLRLYPAAWIFARSSIAEDQVGNFRIPPGANLLISPYITHRSPDYWPEPDRFNPERFGAEASKPAHKLAYYPFGAGPRLCIGRDFALMEATLLLAMLWQRYRISKADGYRADPVPLVTLRPRGQVRVRLTPRV